MQESHGNNQQSPLVILMQSELKNSSGTFKPQHFELKINVLQAMQIINSRQIELENPQHENAMYI